MDQPNILWIILDTLREDYSGPIWKVLSRFGFKKYDNAIATSPWTTPSHASMVTGEYPSAHGAHETKTKKDWSVKLDPSSWQIQKALSTEHGYKVVLLTANMHISAYFGFTGFEFYDTHRDREKKIFTFEEFLKYKHIVDAIKKGGILKGLSENPFVTAKYLADRAFNRIYKGGILDLLFLFVYGGKKYVKARYPLEKMIFNARFSWFGNTPIFSFFFGDHLWPIDMGGEYALSKALKVLNTKEPAFVMVNMMEMHEPYVPGDRPYIYKKENLKKNYLDEKVVKIWRELYPKEAEYLAGILGNFFARMKEKSLLKKTLIVVTSDHGQLLGEHGRIGHGTFLYDELLRVPLFVRYPDEVEPSGSKGFFSLRKLCDFTLKYVEEPVDCGAFYEETVYSESYGIEMEYDPPQTEEERTNVEKLEKYRVAVYSSEGYAIFNVSDWIPEKVIAKDKNFSEKNVEKAVASFLRSNVLREHTRRKIRRIMKS